MKIGYRGWKVAEVEGEPTLVSPSSPFNWVPGENVAQGGELTEFNRCGFYALKSPEAVFEYFWNPRCPNIDIIGEVLLYGKVIEGEVGYRGELARVGVLLLPSVKPISPEQLVILANRYNTVLSVTIGHTRKVIESYRNLLARQRLDQRFKKSRRCTAGGKAIADVRKDGFLL